MNILDFIIVIMCVAALGIALWNPNFHKDIEGIGGEIVMAIRNIIQFLRLILFLKNQQKTEVTAMKMIDFSKLGEVEHRKKHSEIPVNVTEEVEEHINFVRGQNHSVVVNEKMVSLVEIDHEADSEVVN